MTKDLLIAQHKLNCAQHEHTRNVLALCVITQSYISSKSSLLKDQVLRIQNESERSKRDLDACELDVYRLLNSLP